jgi:hypothetical protein
MMPQKPLTPRQHGLGDATVFATLVERDIAIRQIYWAHPDRFSADLMSVPPVASVTLVA